MTSEQAEGVRRELGVQPRPVRGFSRSEVLILAALRSAPLGLLSIRAVARRAGISPTSASRALARLRERGLVRAERRMIEAGRAHEATVWSAALGNPEWSELDPILDPIELPSGGGGQRPRRVPSRLRHLFWNTDPSQLELEGSGGYIARRLLRTMDLQGLAWGASHLSAEDWREGAHARNLDPRARALAENLAIEAER